MEAVLVSAGVVAIAELGDKTQLLAVLLAARFRAPIPIVLGIFCATVLNHLLAATLGTLIADWLSPDNLRWILAVSFVGMAVWMLLPEKEAKGPAPRHDNFGAFTATFISFFLVEMGDATQIATVALAAHYRNIVPVVIGTTIGMMLADVPAVYLGEIALKRVPMKFARLSAAVMFLLLALAASLDLGHRLFAS